MEGDGMQLLHLSPIPELSEIELSTMLEQLSGLSDLNSDLTDRNVEDILKEAEELIDKSSSSKYDDCEIAQKDNALENNLPYSEENLLPVDIENTQLENKTEESTSQLCSISSEQESSRNTGKGDRPNSFVSKNTESGKVEYSSARQDPSSLFSPRHTTNHIKSTIDSLKEFSSLIEKQFSERRISPTSSLSKDRDKHSIKSKEDASSLANESIVLDDSLSDKSKLSAKTNVESGRKLKLKKNSTETLSIEKSIKMLNCFERLYKDRPSRLSGNNRKPKPIEKTSRVIAKKKTIGLKPSENISTKVGKSCTNKEKILLQMSCKKNPENDKNIKVLASQDSHLETGTESWQMVDFDNNNKEELGFYLKPKIDSDCHCRFSSKSLATEGCSLKDPTHIENKQKIDERLMLTLLDEMTALKNQIKQAGHPQLSDRTIRSGDIAGLINGPPTSDEDFLSGKISNEAVKRDEIIRLEEQFFTLKNKYDQQLEKLELQNSKLKEELNNWKKIENVERNYNDTYRKEASPFDNSEQVEPQNHENWVSSTSPTTNIENQITRSVSLENCRVPRNSPTTNNNKENSISVLVKEAFSQTERELRSAGVQCAKEDGPLNQVISESDELAGDKILVGACGRATTENKENLSMMKKKPFKSKPCSDANVYSKQKKVTSEYELQLMATLRKLQAEITEKDKENRKMRTEMDMLRAHIKRLSKKKIEGPRRSQTIGTQTIALGPIVQRPYNPEVYEGKKLDFVREIDMAEPVRTSEFERENDELKARLKALEDSFELLKEKRVNDLQALHQVHEKEMAKLLSKLDTQSALTKHLHSLLLNR